MSRAKYYIVLIWQVIALTLLGGTSAVAQKAGDIPPASVGTVAQFSGLDDETLDAALATAQQRERISDHLERFVKRRRPQLYTYRAVWAEMVERLENLTASAAENTFDPCEFVTDEAVEKAQAAVKKAAERFREQCRQASDRIDTLLESNQCLLVRNALANGDIPAPYRWLSLDENTRDQIRRLVCVHRARVELTKKYAHLKGKVSPEQLESQIAAILSVQQIQTLEAIRQRLQTGQSDPPDQTAKAKETAHKPGGLQ